MYYKNILRNIYTRYFYSGMFNNPYYV